MMNRILLLAIVLANIFGNQERVFAILEYFDHSVIASDCPPCAQEGQLILNNSGSAVDAAITILLCMGIYNPQSSGIGGGFLMTVYSRLLRTPEVIDAREVAPAAATENMFGGDNTLATKGSLSIAVPGEIRGMALAHKRHGNLPWRTLFQPAIKMARNGIVVGKALAKVLSKRKKIILDNPYFRAIFVKPNTRKVLKEGDIMKRPKLAETLNEIAEKGPDEFYVGNVAKKLINDIKRFKGIITADDLKNYQPLAKFPTVTNLRRRLKLFSVPPPGSGYILGFIIKVLNWFVFKESSFSGLENTTLTYHRFLEALKYGYAYRTKLGDETKVNISKVIKNLTSEGLMYQTGREILDDKTFEPSHYGAEAIQEDYGTSHLSILSSLGDAVSVTSSINRWFGSDLISPSTGIILNDQMDDFSSPGIINAYGVPPSKANFIQPGKRPQSSMCPAIIVNKEGDADMVIGAAGGIHIISAVSLTIMKTLWLGKNIKEAIEEPRLHHQLFPNVAEYEKSFPEDIITRLEFIGHVTKSRTYQSVVLGIKRLQTDQLTASYDYRKGGIVVGY